MIRQPLPFEDAIRFLLDKEQLPAEWNAAEWQAQEADFKKRAFWISRIESARFVDRTQGLLFDFLAQVRDDVTLPSGERTTALRVGGRADFVKLMRDFMISEGMADESEFEFVDQNDVKDIRSMARLNLIFDTTVRQSYGYGHYRQGMTPAVRRAFPAARLIRDRGVRVPRERHAEHLGEVRLKTDASWWADYQNDPQIGGFGVPWGPYGFNSGVNQEDVSKRESEELGLHDNAGQVAVPSINEGTSASTKGMDPDLKATLLEELRNRRRPASPAEAAREEAAKVRREMLNRGLSEAEFRGDANHVEKYRKALAELPGYSPLRVRDEGDRIAIE